MVTLPLLFLLLLLSVSADICPIGGQCARACSCFPFISYCDTTTDRNGSCLFTSYGIWFIVGISITCAFCLIVVTCLLYCCCCRKGGDSSTTTVKETNNHHHYYPNPKEFEKHTEI